MSKSFASDTQSQIKPVDSRRAANFTVAESDSVNGISANKFRELPYQPTNHIAFQGRLEIPGSRFDMPEQKFTGVFSGSEVVFENIPANAWPKIRIELIAEL